LVSGEAGERPVTPPQTSGRWALVQGRGATSAPSQNERQEPLLSVLRGGTRRSWAFHKTGVAVAAFALVAITGCGGGEGVAQDATVTAYVVAPLCVGAKQELARQGGRAGELRVQAACLLSARSQAKLDLATLGANARRATEDSTTVAYLEASDPAAARFTHPILETAEVPWIAGSSGNVTMARLLKLIEASGSGSLRQSLREELNES
jgi:hypothetical protein